jgi:hypothetical protein
MITLSEVPVGSGILGALSTSINLSGITIPVALPGQRSVALGLPMGAGGTTGLFANPGFVSGTLVGSLNYATGVWTAPGPPLTYGWYDFSILFSIAIDISPFQNITSTDNPNGFMGVGGPPTPDYLIAGTPQTLSFPDYIGRWAVALTDVGGGIVICSNETLVTYNHSNVIISASYTARRVEGGTQLVVRVLNKTNNAIKGNTGNSYHFTATHLKNYPF